MNKKGVSDRLAEIEQRIDASDELLSAEQREAIKERAREHVRTKQIERETDRLFKQQVRLFEIEMAEGDDELVEITIDLPRYAFMLTIDGTGYYHGCTYDVPLRKYRSLIDNAARAWEHDREVHGDRRQADVMRDPEGRGVNNSRTTQMSMGSGRVNRLDNLRPRR